VRDRGGRGGGETASLALLSSSPTLKDSDDSTQYIAFGIIHTLWVWPIGMCLKITKRKVSGTGSVPGLRKSYSQPLGPDLENTFFPIRHI